MELMNPTVTIQNARGVHWLVTVNHTFNEDERVDFTVKVSKSDKSMPQVQLEALDRVTEILRVMARSLEKDTPDA